MLGSYYETGTGSSFGAEILRYCEVRGWSAGAPIPKLCPGRKLNLFAEPDSMVAIAKSGADAVTGLAPVGPEVRRRLVEMAFDGCPGRPAGGLFHRRA